MDARIPMSRVMSEITMEVTVTGVRTAIVRMLIGRFLIRLAAWVMGVNVRIETETREAY